MQDEERLIKKPMGGALQGAHSQRFNLLLGLDGGSLFVWRWHKRRSPVWVVIVISGPIGRTNWRPTEAGRHFAVDCSFQSDSPSNNG